MCVRARVYVYAVVVWEAIVVQAYVDTDKWWECFDTTTIATTSFDIIRVSLKDKDLVLLLAPRQNWSGCGDLAAAF